MIYFDEVESVVEVDIADCADIWNYDERCQDQNGGNFLVSDVIVHNSIPEVIANRDDPEQLWKDKMDKNFLGILESTYGKIVYQEQLTALWQNIAGFTGPEAQEARKAVAKKWTHKLKDIEKKWVEGAGKVIGEDAAKKAFEEQVSFGRYAFNKCLFKGTLLRCERTGMTQTIEEWYLSGAMPVLITYDNDGDVVTQDECVLLHDTGIQEIFEVEFDDGTTERVTIDHKFLCEDGEYHTVQEIYDNGLAVKRIKSG